MPIWRLGAGGNSRARRANLRSNRRAQWERMTCGSLRRRIWQEPLCSLRIGTLNTCRACGSTSVSCNHPDLGATRDMGLVVGTSRPGMRSRRCWSRPAVRPPFGSADRLESWRRTASRARLWNQAASAVRAPRIARMSAGRVRQQPPMTVAPSRRHSRASCGRSAVSAGVSQTFRTGSQRPSPFG